MIASTTMTYRQAKNLNIVGRQKAYDTNENIDMGVSGLTVSYGADSDDGGPSDVMASGSSSLSLGVGKTGLVSLLVNVRGISHLLLVDSLNRVSELSI
jgi:hypothetical protein